MNLTNQALGAAWREKSFGQRLKFGLPGGKFVPLGPRTIFLGRANRRMHLPISRMNHFFAPAPPLVEILKKDVITVENIAVIGYIWLVAGASGRFRRREG